jgi:excisionase family DNA binding protein
LIERLCIRANPDDPVTVEQSMSEIENMLEWVGLLSPAEAAKYLGMGKTKLYAEINSGRLKAKRHQGQTLIPKEALDAWKAALPDHIPADTQKAARMREIQHKRRGRK